MSRFWAPMARTEHSSTTRTHIILTITDARGITYLTNQYDSNNRVIKQTLANGATYQFAYMLGSSGSITQTNLTDYF